MDKYRERFVDLAEKRVNRAINYIRLIGNLSNTSNYKYSQDDVNKIIRALTAAVKDTEGRFKRNGDVENDYFKL